MPVFCTVGGDAVVRMWSLRERRQLTEAALPTSGTSCAFSNDGNLLVVGVSNNFNFFFFFLNFCFFSFLIQLMLLFSIVLRSRPSPLDDVYGTKMLVRSGDFLC